VNREASPRVAAFAVLGGLGLIAALVTRRPELAALGAPFLLVLGAGLLTDTDPELRASVRVDHDRLVEDDELTVEIDLEAAHTIARLELLLELPAGLVVTEGDNPVAVRVAGPRTVSLRLRAERWGAYTVGDLTVRARDPLGLFARCGRIRAATPVKAYPTQESLRRLLRPAETQLYSGDELARTKGEGLEFADLRPFMFGDRVRRINWRASARRGELWVNDRHPERNTDVIVFLDTFDEAGKGDRSTLDLAVRAAAAIVDRYFRRRDRVGLVAFGGALRWLFPASGTVQLYRIVDALIDTEIVLSYTWRGVDVIPQRTLTPKALVIALTPLLDERAAGALIDLRARGFDLAIVEISPIPFVVPGRLEHEQLAYEIWKLRREALRGQYERAGVPVAVWNDDVPLVAALEEVRAFRRYARPAHA
jgi:uncharacterized protein (DUF58 family)